MVSLLKIAGLTRERYFYKSIIGVVFLVVFIFQGFTGADILTNSDEVLRDVRQVLNLSRKEADAGKKVQLSGVILCADARFQLCFLHDGKAGIYLYFSPQIPPLKHGQKVEITGVSSSGRYANIVVVSNYVILGEAQIPEPQRLLASQLVRGEHDSQWIETEGVVRRERAEWESWLLELNSEGERFPVRILNFKPEFDQCYLGGRILVRGIAAARLNDANQVVGFQVFVASTNDVRLLERPELDYRKIPLVQGRKIFSIDSREQSGALVRLRGVLLINHGDFTLFVKDSSGGFKVETQKPVQLPPGNVIEIVGFPTRSVHGHYIEDAFVYDCGETNLLKPALISASDCYSGAYDYDLVSINAILLEKSSLSVENQQTLLLAVDKERIEAKILNIYDLNSRCSLPEGSKIKITGVLVPQYNQNAYKTKISLLVADASAIKLVALPGRWLIWRIGIFACVLTILVGGWFLWGISLHSKVKKETSVLRNREVELQKRYQDLFENSNDILFSIDSTGLILDWNKAAEVVTGFTRDKTVLKTKIFELLDEASADLVAKLLNKYNQGTTRERFEIILKSNSGGRKIVEADSISETDLNGNRTVRFVGRDITAKKETESELRQSRELLKRFIEERERLSKNLHDSLIQSIYACGLLLEKCVCNTEATSDVSSKIKLVQTELNRLIRELRCFIAGLQPEVSDDFLQSVTNMVEILKISQDTEIKLTISPEVVRRLNPWEASHLLHIIREVLSNAVRHASADNIQLGIFDGNGEIIVEVTDNGKGFDSSLTKPYSFGIRNVVARCKEIGAKLEIKSAIGSGTQVKIILNKNKLKLND